MGLQDDDVTHCLRIGYDGCACSVVTDKRWLTDRELTNKIRASVSVVTVVTVHGCVIELIRIEILLADGRSGNSVMLGYSVYLSGQIGVQTVDSRWEVE